MSLHSDASILAINEPAKPKIAILGAGLLGRMLTVSLMEDYQVSLYDQDTGHAEDSAGYLAAAMLAPLAESADASEEVMKLGEHALGLWPNFLQQLDQHVFFQQAGSMVVAFAQDAAVFDQFQTRLKGDDYQLVEHQQIVEIEPDLAKRFSRGMFLPNEAQLDNRQLLEAMAAKIKQSDVSWHIASTAVIENGQLFVNGEKLSGFDQIIDCRGVGARQELSEQPAKLRGVRGEVVRIYAPDVNLSRPIRIMHPRYPIYIAPKENNLFVIGATQLESEDTREPTVRSALELLSACFSVHSGFAEAEILSIDAGLRPAFIDNEPRIYKQGNIITVNGMFRHGYLLAPAVAAATVAALKGEDSELQKILKIMPNLFQSGSPYLAA